MLFRSVNLSSLELGFINAGRAGCPEVGGGVFIPLQEICPLEFTWAGDSVLSGPETPVRGPETLGRAETPHPGGVFVNDVQLTGDSGHQGPDTPASRRLRAHSGGTPKRPQYRTTSWRRAGKSRGRRLRPWQTGDSGLGLTCSK